ARTDPAERDESSLGGDDHLVAPQRARLDQIGQGRADAPLAALTSVVDSAVEDVAAGPHRLRDRFDVATVGQTVVGPEVGSQTDRRGREALKVAIVPGLEQGREPRDIPARPFGGRPAGRSHHDWSLRCGGRFPCPAGSRSWSPPPAAGAGYVRSGSSTSPPIIMERRWRIPLI